MDDPGMVVCPADVFHALLPEERVLVLVDGAEVALRQRALARSVGVPAGLVVVAGDPLALIVNTLAVLAAGGVAFVAPPGTDLRALAVGVQAAGILDDSAPLVSMGHQRTMPEGAALVLQTSGSSGEPRRVVLTAGGVWANVQSILGYLPAQAHQRVGIELPLHYSYALVGQLFTALAAGAVPVLLHGPFVAARVQRARELGVTGLSSVASALGGWCAVLADLAPAERPALAFVASAGGPLSPEMAQTLARGFPGAVLFNQYGQTEASPRICAISSDDARFFEGAVGTPLPGISVAVACGELVVDTPCAMWGYLDAPEATARKLDGGLRTGDLARIDDDGCVWILGRSDDLVSLGGERLSLVQLQRGVQAALGRRCWLGVDGEGALVAVVEAAERDPRAWRRACRGLAASHRPSRWLAVASLPHLAVGKLDRKGLQALITAESS